MLSGMKTIVFCLMGAFALVFSGSALAVLTTDELTRLKASGLGEEVILFMIENDYGNIDRVVKLKEAGFADATISSVIRSDLKAGVETKRPVLQPEQVKPVEPVAEPMKPVAKPMAEATAIMQTSGKVMIEQYVAIGEPVVQKSQDISDATISLLQGRRLKIEWGGSQPTSTMDNLLLRGKPFTSPFYWDLDKGDGVHSVSSRDNAFILRTGHLHQGSPRTNKSHYWVMHLTPGSPDLEKRIRALLSE